MTTDALPGSYLDDGLTLRSWLTTTDHKRIAILYALSITAFFFVGGAAATIIRMELATPAGDLVSNDAYDKLFTAHGVIMVWLFLIPSIPSVLGNFLLPLMLGARDLAFPRLNLLSWYLYMAGGLITLEALLLGGVDTGWTFYTPYSTMFSNTYVVLTLVGVFVTGFSSILTGLNFIVTIHTLRAPAMGWFKLPLFAWAMYATSLILVLATPVLAVTTLLVAAERLFQIGIFDPAYGGDPLLFQHLFWFYSHPAVYIMILPAMGVVAEIVPTFARKNQFSYKALAYSSLGIAFIGFLTWGHHLFVAGISQLDAALFGIMSMFVAIFSAIKVFTWVGTLYRGSIAVKTPLIYICGFLFFIVFGGMTGIAVATVSLDVHWHDTYFVVAHFHFIMVGGVIMAFLAGLHYWFPKMFGKTYHEGWGMTAAAFIILGFNATFIPQFLLGNAGMPRRYYMYPERFTALNVASTAGSSLLAFGFVIILIYLVFALVRGKVAGPNPWGSRGYEWETSSPPIKENFEVTPVITQDPHSYQKPGEEVEHVVV